MDQVRTERGLVRRMSSMTDSAVVDSYEHYDSLAELDEGALRGLIQRGRPDEKVWAAWRLALVAGGEADGTLTDALAEEPTAGVRAHWIIVLYSHGETDLVSVLAQHDPSPLVRETAVRYLAPTVGRPTTAWLGPTLAACLADSAPRVRQTAVRHLAPSPGPELLARVQGMVQDADAQVRMAALEYLLAHHPTSLEVIGPYAADEDVHVRRRAVGALTSAALEDTDWILDRLVVEVDDAARDQLTETILAAGQEDRLAQHLATHAPLMVHDILAPLARQERRFAWSVLAPLFGACPDSPTLLVLCACLETSTIPLGSATALVDEATAYYENEELWLPHLIQITRPLLDRLPPEKRAGFPALRVLLVDELEAARAQRWGPIDTLEALLELLET